VLILRKLIDLMGTLGDYFQMTAEVHTLLLFAFWAFDKKPPKFISWAKPEKDQFDTSSSSTSTEPPLCKRSKTTNYSEALAHALRLIH